MTLEDTLSNMGAEPISAAENFRQMMAFLNGSLIRAGQEKVTEATPSDQVLQAIYSIPDQAQREAILFREYKEMPKKDSYKSVVIGATTIIAAIVIAALVGIVKAEGPMDANTADLFKLISQGLIELLKAIIGSGQ
ncbi:virion structural protein [Pseudomonas phage PhiPA3]|uniref:Virion structural protein n=1 Tax=Pseudomonas phage PhiPA3 TaxID=998086 RepID=F8SK34_BPPA3|nr:virion structural protein [Pseudomonas phage PhiPA3]AEH03584.1 virion structural protein [Pseudomonas phage PhiPA3]